MDHSQNLHPSGSAPAAASPLPERAHTTETFLDEPLPLPQGSQTQGQHQEEPSRVRRPLHLETLGADDDDSLVQDDPTSSYNHNPNNPNSHHGSAASQLPLLLKLLFGLNGLSLSLLTLPIMYILNTRVAVPLPYLPAYGAIAFLPYSLKPVYAYLCGVWAKQQPKASKRTTRATPFSSNGNTTSNSRNHSNPINVESNQHNNTNNNNNYYYNPHRYLTLFRWLLASNSLFTLWFASIPEGGVLAVFVVAFLRGVTDSWAEFCLGLTLIDHARAYALQNSHNGSSTYETTVSGLQAQAATAGNLGAWLASLVTCLVLLWRRFAAEQTNDSDNDSGPVEQLTGGLTNALVMTTALVQLGGAVAVYYWEKTSSNRNLRNNDGGFYEEIPTQARRHPIDQASTTRQHFEAPTESDSLRDEESSHPSYSSLDDLSDDSDDESSLSTEGSSLLRNSSSNSRHPSSQSSPQRIANWAMVILLQCVLVVIALKGPIVEVSSHFVWVVVVVTLTVGLVLASITLCCKLGSANEKDHDTTTFRVGLFLVLKNAIPRDSAILASFFYSLFGTNQPLLLQFLSFLGMGVSSLSSWSYTKVFSKRFGAGKPLVGLLAGTTVLASLVSLLHIAVVRIYQTTSSNTNSTDEESYIPSRNLLVMAVVSKFVTTFFDEWAFLPELVLATTSVTVPTTTAAAAAAAAAATAAESTPTNSTSPSPVDTVDDLEAAPPSGNAMLSRTLPQDDVSGGNHNDDQQQQQQQQQQQIAMEYGTLVSCIDFGDQLGSLLAAPLVAVWQISRENDFLHLDRLIVFCSVANMAITIGLLPLVWKTNAKGSRR